MITPRAWLPRVTLGLSVGCGLPVTESGGKLSGVGVNPEEVRNSAPAYGGIIEFDWIDFAGGGLPLALAGLVSYDAVGPGFSDVAPPYAMIYGVGFVMNADLVAADSLFGSFGVPPELPGSCYTTYEPRAFLSGLADVGNEIKFAATDGSFEYDLGRYYPVYPENNVSALFPYYSGLYHWQPEALTRLGEIDSGETFADAGEEVLVPPNFVHGTETRITWRGGMPNPDAPTNSIPMPLAAAGGVDTFTLPERPTGVMLSWNGPRYDTGGGLAQSGGAQTACLQFLQHDDAPIDTSDCESYQEPPEDGAGFSGQLYTGPWDTEGGVTFNWVPGTQGHDTLTIAVRFLSEVDTDDEYKRESAVTYPTTSTVERAWEEMQSLGYIPEDATVPSEGRREALPCEDSVEADGDPDYTWEVEQSLLDAEGEFPISLQGEPSSTLAEVVCHVPDTGSFTVTSDMLTDAWDYALRKNGGGAIFYVSRSSALDLETPDVRDNYGKRREISPVRVVSNAVQVGRFWWDQ